MEKKNKKTQVITTLTDTAKRKGPKGLTKKNLQNSAKELKSTASTREVKYNYPADCITADQRKEFRRKSRASARRFEKQEQALKASTERGSKKLLQELTKEKANFQQAIYTHKN